MSTCYKVVKSTPRGFKDVCVCSSIMCVIVIYRKCTQGMQVVILCISTIARIFTVQASCNMLFILRQVAHLKAVIGCPICVP